MIDLLIIGGGPAGYVAAERAAQEGMSVTLFEKKALGGVCLNEGCIPTKTLLYSAKIYDNAVNSKAYGVTTENVGFEYKRIMSRKKRVVRRLVAGVRGKMQENNVTVIEGEAQIVSRSDEGIEVRANDEIYKGKTLLISTGSEAFVPPIPGVKEAGDIVITNREILEMNEKPESLVVIGGGVIGMEFASFFNSLGTEVTVIEMLPEILGNNDFEVSEMLRKNYAKRGITFHLEAKVVEIDGNKVIFEKDGERQTVEGAKILMSVGRRAVTQGLGFENIGLELDRGGVKVDEKMRTNVPNVYAAGDVTGFSLLAHTASREGEVVVNNLAGKPDTMSYKAIPGVVYTNPEVAGVGETEESARAKELDYKVVKLPMAFSGRFIAENDRENGIVKVLVGAKHNEVIGVHMLGGPSGEIIYGACMAIEQEMTLDEMKKIVFPHPTVSEIIKEALFEF